MKDIVETMRSRSSRICAEETDETDFVISTIRTPFDDKMVLLKAAHLKNAFVVDALDPARQPVYDVCGARGGLKYRNYSDILPRREHTWEDYQKLQYLGGGTFSSVFLGKLRSKWLSDERFALKYLVRPFDLYKETREIKLLELLSGGPNIVRLRDVVMEKKNRYRILVMQYVNQNRKYPQIRASFNDLKVRNYLYQLLTGLQYIHSMGIIHKGNIGFPYFPG